MLTKKTESPHKTSSPLKINSSLNYIEDTSMVSSHPPSERSFLNINPLTLAMRTSVQNYQNNLLKSTKTPNYRNIDKTKRMTIAGVGIGFGQFTRTHFSDNDIIETDADFTCAFHENNKIILHCCDCQVPLCVKCLKTHHNDKKKHDYIEINELQETICMEATKYVQELENKVQNLEPEFSLDEIQQRGLDEIYESKEILLNAIDAFYNSFINNFNSLTYKNPISQEKKSILEKQKELLGDLQTFTKKDNNNVNIFEYFRSNFSQKIQSLQEKIENFQKEIKKEFRLLPKVKRNSNVLKDLQNVLLNYISILFENEQDGSPVGRTTTTPLKPISEIKTRRNVINQPAYFKTQRKYLHHLFNLDHKLFLYDVDNHKSLIYNLGSMDLELPSYPCTIFTPDLDLYILGGYYQKNRKCVNKTYKYDKEEGLVSLASMLDRKMAFGTCYVKGLIYIFGGKKEKEDEILDLCERYSIKSNKWEPIGKMKEKRCSPGVCNFNDEKIYIFFGTKPINKYPCDIDVIEKYNIKKNSWSIIYVKNWLNGFEMSQISCQQVNSNQILLFGGVTRTGNPNNSEKTYFFSRRIMLFDVNERTLENLGDCLPEGNLNLGQSFIENNCVYSLRTVKSTSEEHFENGFIILKIDQNLFPRNINLINCKDIRVIMKLRKTRDKMD